MVQVGMWEQIVQGPFLLWKAFKDLLKYSLSAKGVFVASQT